MVSSRSESQTANLSPMCDGGLNCVAQRVVEHFEGALRGQGLTPARRQKIQEWEAQDREPGATIGDVAALEKILKRAIILRDIAGEYIWNSGKYQVSKWKPIELIVHNGHAWGKELHFPLSREVHIFEGDVWEAIREATRGSLAAVWLLVAPRGKGSSLWTNSSLKTVEHTGRVRSTKESIKPVKAWPTWSRLRTTTWAILSPLPNGVLAKATPPASSL